MNRMVRFLKNDQVPQIKKVGLLFAAVISTLLLAFVAGKIICAVTVLGVASWAYVEKRNCDQADKDAADFIQEERRLVEGQRAALAKMKEAFGGEEVYNALPHLDIGNRTGDTGYIDFLKVQELSKPIMKGTDVLGRPFVALRVRFKDSDKNPFVIALFQRYVEGGSWSFGSRKDWDTFQTRLDDRDWNVVRQIRAGNHPRLQLV
jgi:hypothetical protein